MSDRLPLLTTYDALEALYSNRCLTSSWLIKSEFEREKFNEFNKEIKFEFSEDGIVANEQTLLIDPNNVSEDELIKQGLNNWFMPDKYKEIDLKQYLLDKCKNDIERNRVLYELKLFNARNLDNILKFLIYFIDQLRENKIVWGVGRGSSVSSFILYLIGVHKIDSIKYDLSVEDFLR